MGLGVALAKDETYKKFSRYASSTFYSKLSKNRAKRDLRDRVATKIGIRLHTSRKVVIENFPYFEIMFQEDDLARELAEYFDLDDAEIKQFRSRKIKKKKVKKVTRAKTTKKPTPSTKSSSSSKNSGKIIKEKVTVENTKSKDPDSSAKNDSKTEDSKDSVTPGKLESLAKTSEPRKKKSTSKSAKSMDKDESGKSKSKENGTQTSLFSFK